MLGSTACRVGLALGVGLAAAAWSGAPRDSAALTFGSPAIESVATAAAVSAASAAPVVVEAAPRAATVARDAAPDRVAAGHAAQTPSATSDLDLVPLVVSVVDRDRKPVTGLTQDDFTITEDGVPQTIRQFSAQSLEPGEAGRGPALIAPGQAPLAPQPQRLFVFVLGAGRLEEGSKTITELAGFVRTSLLPEDQVAVVAFGRALEFTADRQRLIDVLERVRRQHADIDFDLSLQMGPTGMAPLYGTRVLPRKLQTRIEQLVFGPAGRAQAPAVADTIGHAAFADLPLDDFMAATALSAEDQGNLHALLEYLRHFGGRKHLLFVTEKGLTWPAEESDRALAALANEGRVAIHTLQVGGILAAERGGELAATLQMARSFGSLRTLSELTGGLSSITGSSRTALENLDAVTRSGYVLGYRPSNAAWDGRYRAIDVRVRRSDLTALFRHGYRRERAPVGFDRRGFITVGRLRAGGQFRREVGDIKLKASATVKAGELSVTGTVNLSKLELDVAAGTRTGLLNVGIFCFDSGSNPVGAQIRELPITVTDEQFRQFARNGMPYSIQVPLNRGFSTVRVVFYDYRTDRIGRVDTSLF